MSNGLLSVIKKHHEKILVLAGLTVQTVLAIYLSHPVPS